MKNLCFSPLEFRTGIIQNYEKTGELGVFLGRRGAGFEIGFDWVCFYNLCEGVHFHNPLLILYLRSFGHLVNWVCFA